MKTTPIQNQEKKACRFACGPMVATGETDGWTFDGKTRTEQVVEINGQRCRWTCKTIPLPIRQGDRVKVTMNGFGPGEVVGFHFAWGSEKDELPFGRLVVKPDRQPDWHKRQTDDMAGMNKWPRVFGQEVESL